MVDRAPARGRYDRNASASERAHEQRQLILTAVAAILIEREPDAARLTVADVCERTGLARNTLYGHFEGIEAAVDAAIDGALLALAAPLHDHDDLLLPLEVVRTFAIGWTTVCATDPTATRLALRWARPRLARDLRERVIVIAQQGVRAGTFSVEPHPVRSEMVTAAALAAAAAAASEPAQQAPVAAALAELFIRVCR